MNRLGDELLKEEEQKEKDNIVFLDIETGRGNLNKLRPIVETKIRNKISNEKFVPRDNWKPETNKRKAEEFEENKEIKIASEVNKIIKGDAKSPFYNRIVLAAIGDINFNIEQIDELQATEEGMIRWISDKINKKKVVVFSSFDMKTIELKAIKYRTKLNHYGIVDLSKIATYWPMIGPKNVISQDVLAVLLDIRPNRFVNLIKPSEIGEAYELENMHLGDKDLIKMIKKYNEDDVRVLIELYKIIYR